ncbi:restriction endonuclease subunit S [Lactobacillus sp. W8092]|nr:restriction endonuclease subunit S [Lactobacillus sp. W8092]
MNEQKAVPNIRFKSFEYEWKLVYLGNIGFFKSGVGFPRNEQGKKNGTPFYKVSDLGINFKLELERPKNYVTAKQIKNNKWKVIDPTKNGAVVFAKIGAAIFLDRKRMIMSPFLIDNNLMAYVISDKVNRKFMMNILQIINFSNFAQVGAIPSISSSDLRKTKISLPIEIFEQQKIGDFFTKLDKLLDLQQQKIDKLELLKKTFLQKLFPNHDAKIPELRFQGFDDDWNEKRLNSITKRLDSYRKPITANKRLPGQTPYYGANGIQDYVKGYTHEGEFVLIAEDGANDVKNYPVRFVKGYIWVNNHAHVLQAKASISNNLFLSYSLKNKNLLPYLVGSGRMKLNADVLMNLLLKIPSFKEQQKIGNLLSKVDQLIELENKKLHNLQQVKKCLLQNMFVE